MVDAPLTQTFFLATLQNMQAELFGKFEGIGARFERLEARMIKMEERMTGMEERMQTMEADIRSMKGESRSLDAKITSLDGKMQSVMERIEDVHIELTIKIERVRTEFLEKLASTRDSLVYTTENVHEDLNNSIDALALQLGTLEVQMARFDTKRDDLRAFCVRRADTTDQRLKTFKDAIIKQKYNQRIQKLEKLAGAVAKR